MPISLGTKIPEDLVDFLESGVSILVGTRNAKLEPEATRSCGAQISKDREHVTLFFPDWARRAIVDIQENGEIAVCFSRMLDNYSIQIKGGGATPEDQAKIQAILEAATEFQKAEFLLKRNMGDPQAYDIVKRCTMLDPEQADYLATLAWLDAQKPEWLGREKTLEKCLLLDRCVQKNPNCERAYFYRGLLYKRAEEFHKALKDFKKAAELNPRNLDAAREVRLHVIRRTSGAPGARTSKPPEPESLGGIFGKLFKK